MPETARQTVVSILRFCGGLLKKSLQMALVRALFIARIRGFIKKAPAEKTELDVNEVIQEVLALAGHELQKNQVLVECHLTETLPLVRADRVQLQQVLLNLIMNGIEAMTGATNQPRVLGVESRIDESGNVLVEVRDSGAGLGLEADRLFTPFFTTKANGMGMGLPISRSLIEGHGGRLWASPTLPTVLCFHSRCQQLARVLHERGFPGLCCRR